MSERILVVDDESDFCQVVKYHLEKEGFLVEVLNEGRLVMANLEKTRPALLLLDWMLPDVSGIDILKAIRRHSYLSDLPVIMLTARNQEIDRVLGLELGADDYVTKPFSMKELVARVKGIRRRVAGGRASSKDVYDDGTLMVDNQRHLATLHGHPINLTAREFDVLFFLVQHRGKVHSREQLLDRVWRDELNITDRTVDVRIHRVRSALEAAGGKADWIQTIRGKGYIFDPFRSQAPPVPDHPAQFPEK